VFVSSSVLPASYAPHVRALLPGKSLMKLMFADYKKTSLGPYKEVVVQIPALYKGQLSL
jgi:hypothetical protein